jgi:nitroimidazol reductase NimA-like FMN-containing flavoprotein (pyridoxamine 5'-phosphate oxidase superfamily)
MSENSDPARPPNVTPPGVTPPDSAASTVRREAHLATYSRDSIYQVLDEGYLAHVGIIAADGRPTVIPTLFGREGEVLYLHGSVASRLVRTLAEGVDCSVEVTLVDGLVLARSAFLHSMNYRSVVIFGRARRVEATEQVHALKIISDHLLPGRWEETRQPSEAELRQTCVLALSIEEASAKIRTGGPTEEEPEDIALPIWAGELPLETTWGSPIPAADLAEGVGSSAAVQAGLRRR